MVYLFIGKMKSYSARHIHIQNLKMVITVPLGMLGHWLQYYIYIYIFFFFFWGGGGEGYQSPNDFDYIF